MTRALFKLKKVIDHSSYAYQQMLQTCAPDR